MKRLAGKVALITGGGSGIGAATASLMASEGARIAIVGRNENKLAETVSAIREGGGEAIYLQADIEQEAAIEAMVGQATEQLGGLDVLVCNAATTESEFLAADGLTAEQDLAVWNRSLAINLTGAMLSCKYAIPHMVKAGGGSIVFSGSGKGIQGDVGQLAYGVSKAGLNQLMRSIATQYGKQGVRANVALIGLVLTDVLKKSFPADRIKLMEEHHLTPYLGEPQHVAELIAFLASDAAAFITGAIVPVDGGFTSHAPIYADVLRMMK